MIRSAKSSISCLPVVALAYTWGSFAGAEGLSNRLTTALFAAVLDGASLLAVVAAVSRLSVDRSESML